MQALTMIPENRMTELGSTGKFLQTAKIALVLPATG
jgi:hypothetical protein